MTKKFTNQDDLVHITSSQFQQADGEAFENAAREPVIITRYGKPVRVLMNIQDFIYLVNAQKDN